jgi:aconitate hydratase
MNDDSFKCQQQLDVNGQAYEYFSLPAAAASGLEDIDRLPFSLKVLLENLLRHEDGVVVTKEDIQAFPKWLDQCRSTKEIAYHPARVLMQDFTGVPAVVDLAAMRDAMTSLGGKVDRINPLCPVSLVIDHSVQVDVFGRKDAYSKNVQIEMQRNAERYQFLKWGQHTFDDFAVVPPGTGICHQVNLEYVAKTVWTKTIGGKTFAFPDTLVGTDSHTTMINGLGVLGWGVGGIEAEAALLGQPVSMLIPEVIGFRLLGELNEGITATDLVLKVTQMLRERGVVGKFVEYCGSGLKHLPLADRATISNMAPEYGATCGLFPIDHETIKYLQLTNRDADTVALVEAYAKAQGMWFDDNTPEAAYTDVLELDLSTVVPALAGPKRPQDRVEMDQLPSAAKTMVEMNGKLDEWDAEFSLSDGVAMQHADIVIAAITSCTNTSNPSVMLAAGLVAKKACEKGLQVKPWVKTSLAPGSKVVTDYLAKAGLTPYLDELGFDLVGYGCTTCIGNSGPLPDAVEKLASENDLVACSVLSGNRNFEGRIHPLVKGNWLASPPLVVAYALAGTIRKNLQTEPLGNDKEGNPVFLKDIWPTPAEVQELNAMVSQDMFSREYAQVFAGTPEWQAIAVTKSHTYGWQPESTYVKNPPFFEGMTMDVAAVQNVEGARMLALLGDSVTTDHISPAGAIKSDSPAGQYLQQHDVAQKDFNSYGSRRGNHEVMMRGTFANIRIRNEMLSGVEGGYTRYLPTNEQMSIYDAAMRYQSDGTPLVVIAGKEYGTGSSRDWAAKGTLLLGVKAVVAESFERIHRSNLIGMGVLPLEFPQGVSRKTLALTGEEEISLLGLDGDFVPGMSVRMQVAKQDGSCEEVNLSSRIDTENEANYYRHGGILQYVLRKMMQQS